MCKQLAAAGTLSVSKNKPCPDVILSSPLLVIARHGGAEAISWRGLGLPRFARNDSPLLDKSGNYKNQEAQERCQNGSFVKAICRAAH